MKRFLALALALVMSVSMVACGGDNNGGGTSTKNDPNGIKIVVLTQSSREGEMNIIRDQLTHAGFEVETNIQPDYSSFSAAMANGAYDLAISGWSTACGNLDYAVRGIHHSDGDYNRSPIVDEKIDQLIDKAASETLEASIATYTDLETRLIDEMAYIIPLYARMSLRAYNKEVVDTANLGSYKTSGPYMWEYSYVNEADNATRPLVFTQNSQTMTSLDPVQGNDATMGTTVGNIYAKVIALTEDDNFKTEGTLSHAYAIADGNQEYYFLLRDDVNFAKVEDGKPVDTGILAGGEDVVFSLKRAADGTSTPLHKVATLHTSIKDVTMVTDLNELNTVIDSTTGAPIMDTLKAGIDGEIKALTDKDANVDNAAGTYQVVKVSTYTAFPQVLNYLTHSSAGTLCKEQVEAYNSKFTVDSYDVTKDVCYGDFAEVKRGNNMLYCSGAYVLTGVDDYAATLVKNPAYKPGTDEVAKIDTVQIKFIKDATAATNAFRSGEIDVLSSINETDVATLQADERFEVRKQDANSAFYCYTNLMEGSQMQNVNLRKAVLAAINQNDFVALKDGNVKPLYSTLDTFLQTGKVLTQDFAKSAEYAAAYLADPTPDEVFTNDYYAANFKKAE